MDIMSQRARRCLFGVALVAAITTYAEEPVGARSAAPSRPAAASSPTASTNAPASSWLITTSTDEMTDETVVVIGAVGPAVRVDGFEVEPMLIFRRTGREVEEIYTPGGALRYQRGVNMLSMRIDDGPVVQGRWRASTTRAALFYDGDVAGMARHLRDGRVLRLRSQSTLGHIVTQSIPLDGFGAAWDQLMAHDKPHDTGAILPPENTAKSPQIPTSSPSSKPSTGAQTPLP